MDRRTYSLFFQTHLTSSFPSIVEKVCDVKNWSLVMQRAVDTFEITLRQEIMFVLGPRPSAVGCSRVAIWEGAARGGGAGIKIAASSAVLLPLPLRRA